MNLSRVSAYILKSNMIRFTNIWARRLHQNYKALIDVQESVKQALQFGKPVVALESTIITHGMPWPKNMETALEVEGDVRANGATPATIAVINGRIKVGLTMEELEMLAASKSNEVIKCSRRDLPFLVARSLTGGTTVAATMLISHMVGVKIFATGGIGGVHRQGHVTLDISADLVELGRTPVAVVCSGVKSILDIPRTLEFLETQGVCVATFGSPERRFPDFYTPDSGCRVNYDLQTPEEAASLIRSLHELDMKSGILIGVPIPEQYAANRETIKVAIAQAQADAIERNVSGKEVTPFLLAAVAEKTEGTSLKANIALIKNNAATAARIAHALCGDVKIKKPCVFSRRNTNNLTPLVVGASILDLALTILEDMPNTLEGATYRSQAKQGAGGVGRNLADGLLKLYGAADFISAVGSDHLGNTLLRLMPEQLMKNIKIDEENPTSLCSVICDKAGDCKLILGNMEIHEAIKPNIIEAHENLLSTTPLVIIDSNLPLSTMECILQLARKYGKPVFFEPTDMRISGKPFALDHKLTKQIRIISPNIYELKGIVEAIMKKPFESQAAGSNQISTEPVSAAADMLRLIAHHFDCIVVTMGEHGVLMSFRGTENMPLFDITTGRYLLTKYDSKGTTNFYYFPAKPVDGIVNVSGAGDSFSSGMITGMLKGFTIDRCIALGFIAATCALQTDTAVPKQFFDDEEEEKRLLDQAYTDLKKQSVLWNQEM